jgi:integrase
MHADGNKTMKLNALKLRTLTTHGTYGDGGGLYLQVRGARQRSWLFRYKIKGRGRLMGLGPFPDVGLAEAREAATAARKLLRTGTDPLEQRRHQRADAEAKACAFTFAQVAQRYLAAHEKGWKNAEHRRQIRAALVDVASPIIGSRAIEAISVEDVMRVLEPIWHATPETASRIRGRIEAVIDYATAQGWRVGDNPARWQGHMENLLPARGRLALVVHHPALPWGEVGAFMAELRKQDGVSARALEFSIHTAARSGEVLGATWGEIDMQTAIWTVPSWRMKAGREHRVPLSVQAVAALHEAEIWRTNATPDAIVFPGRRGRRMNRIASFTLLRRMGRGDLTQHGFRSTFREWCAEATNYPREIAERALAHDTGNKVEQAYQRGDHLERRRLLMAEWSDFCTSTPLTTDD